MEKANLRKNIQMSRQLAQWYEDKAKELGMSQSAIMVIALNEYIRTQEMKPTVVNFQEFVKEIEKANRLQPEK